MTNSDEKIPLMTILSPLALKAAKSSLSRVIAFKTVASALQTIYFSSPVQADERSWFRRAARISIDFSKS